MRKILYLCVIFFETYVLFICVDNYSLFLYFQTFYRLRGFVIAQGQSAGWGRYRSVRKPTEVRISSSR